MTTLSILVAFALMLLLPCAFALFGNRNDPDEEQSSTYSDRIVSSAKRLRRAESASMSKAPEGKQEIRSSKTAEINEQKPVAGPAPVMRAAEAHRDRIQRNEIEALMAHAAAARAHANALEANARLAAAKAEAADADALIAEQAASVAVQPARRAA